MSTHRSVPPAELARTDPALRDRVVAAMIVAETLRVFGGDAHRIQADIARHEAKGLSRLAATKRVTAPLWRRWRLSGAAGTTPAPARP